MVQPHLSEFVDAPPLVYLSGQLALHEGEIVEGGIGPQTKQCLQNVNQVLKSLGLELSNVVKTTVWLSRAGDFSGFDETYREVFGKHRPARSTVVSKLVLDDALIEIEAIAYRADGR